MLIPGKPVKPGAGGVPLRSPQEEREWLRELARKAEQELLGVQMASMDELTLLPNRHGFATLAEQGLDACQRLEKPATLLLFNLDDFKRLHYLYGSTASGKALKIFADVLRIAFRESDVIGRLSSDKFVALLTGSGTVELAAIKARLEEILAERNAAARRVNDLRFSLGQIEYDPLRHDSIEGLLAEADAFTWQTTD